MPEIGETRGHGLSRRELAKEKNRKKNEARRQAKQDARRLPKDKAEHARELRTAFGGAFGKAPTKVYNTARLGTRAPERHAWEEDDHKPIKEVVSKWEQPSMLPIIDETVDA